MTKRSIDRLLKFKTLNTSEISNNYLFVSLVFSKNIYSILLSLL